jgi:putative peptide zinc metalloprotease protein
LQLGIALMIYWLLPKAIGLPLAAFALLLSLLAPLAEEVASWWKDRQRLAATARSKATLLALLGVLALMLAPLPATIRIPAVLMSRDEFRLFTPDAGQAVTVNLEPGRRVSKGEILLELKSDEIDSALKLAQIMRDKVAARLRRAAADRQDLALSRVLGGELKAAEAEIAGLLTRRNALVIRAPINGVIGESLWPARAGQWIGANVLVALVHEPSAIRAEGLLSEQDARHLAPGSDGRFFADNLAIAPMSVSVLKISAVPAASLAFPELADVEGGLVPLEPTGGADSEGVPHGSWFPVELATPPGVALAGATTLRGVAVIRSGRQSLLSGLARRLAAVVVRESGL